MHILYLHSQYFTWAGPSVRIGKVFDTSTLILLCLGCIVNADLARSCVHRYLAAVTRIDLSPS